jgi:hypothetical protein
MRRARERANAYSLGVLVTILSAALVFVLPSLLIATSDAAGPVSALAVLLVGLAALVQFETRSVAHAARTAEPHPHSEPAPVLPGRVTDPVHHPLRPRAPGLA